MINDKCVNSHSFKNALLASWGCCQHLRIANQLTIIFNYYYSTLRWRPIRENFVQKTKKGWLVPINECLCFNKRDLTSNTSKILVIKNVMWSEGFYYLLHNLSGQWFLLNEWLFLQLIKQNSKSYGKSTIFTNLIDKRRTISQTTLDCVQTKNREANCK